MFRKVTLVTLMQVVVFFVSQAATDDLRSDTGRLLYAAPGPSTASDTVLKTAVHATMRPIYSIQKYVSTLSPILLYIDGTNKRARRYDTLEKKKLYSIDPISAIYRHSRYCVRGNFEMFVILFDHVTITWH